MTPEPASRNAAHMPGQGLQPRTVLEGSQRLRSGQIFIRPISRLQWGSLAICPKLFGRAGAGRTHMVLSPGDSSTLCLPIPQPLRVTHIRRSAEVPNVYVVVEYLGDCPKKPASPVCRLISTQIIYHHLIWYFDHLLLVTIHDQ